MFFRAADEKIEFFIRPRACSVLKIEPKSVNVVHFATGGKQSRPKKESLEASFYLPHAWCRARYKWKRDRCGFSSAKYKFVHPRDKLASRSFKQKLDNGDGINSSRGRFCLALGRDQLTRHPRWNVASRTPGDLASGYKLKLSFFPFELLPFFTPRSSFWNQKMVN